MGPEVLALVHELENGRLRMLNVTINMYIYTGCCILMSYTRYNFWSIGDEDLTARYLCKARINVRILDAVDNIIINTFKFS